MSRLGDALAYLVGRGVFTARSKAPLVAWITLGSDEHGSSWPSTELAAFDTTTYDTGRSPSLVVVDGGLISVDRADVVHYVLVVDSVEMHAIPQMDEARKEPSLDVSAQETVPRESSGGALVKPTSDQAEVGHEPRPVAKSTRAAENEASVLGTTVRLPSLDVASKLERKKRIPVPANEVFSLMRLVLNITPTSPARRSATDRKRRIQRGSNEAVKCRRLDKQRLERSNRGSEDANLFRERNSPSFCPVLPTWIDIEPAVDSSPSVAPHEAANEPSVAVAY